MDWNSEKDIKALNNWRDQNLRRGPFKQKRVQVRPDYTMEERQWLADEYTRAGYSRPPNGLRDLASRFNARFTEHPCNENGIVSAWDRVRREIDTHGKLMPRRRRGGHWKEKADAKKRGKLELVTVPEQGAKGKGKGGEKATADPGEEGEESCSAEDEK